MTKPHMKIHDPADSERPRGPTETDRCCPFRSAAVPVQMKHPITGETVVDLGFKSGPCVKDCAGYDRENDRNCFDRGFAVLASLRSLPVLKESGT